MGNSQQLEFSQHDFAGTKDLHTKIKSVTNTHQILTYQFSRASNPQIHGSEESSIFKDFSCSQTCTLSSPEKRINSYCGCMWLFSGEHNGTFEEKCKKKNYTQLSDGDPNKMSSRGNMYLPKKITMVLPIRCTTNFH